MKKKEADRLRICVDHCRHLQSKESHSADDGKGAGGETSSAADNGSAVLAVAAARVLASRRVDIAAGRLGLVDGAPGAVVAARLGDNDGGGLLGLAGTGRDTTRGNNTSLGGLFTTGTSGLLTSRAGRLFAAGRAVGAGDNLGGDLANRAVGHGGGTAGDGVHLGDLGGDGFRTSLAGRLASGLLSRLGGGGNGRDRADCGVSGNGNGSDLADGAVGDYRRAAGDGVGRGGVHNGGGKLDRRRSWHGRVTPRGAPGGWGCGTRDFSSRSAGGIGGDDGVGGLEGVGVGLRGLSSAGLRRLRGASLRCRLTTFGLSSGLSNACL